MDMSTRRTVKEQLTRRAVLRGAAMTGGGMLLFGLPGCKQEEKHLAPALAKDASCNDSVFCTACGPNSTTKGYDSPPAYGFFAFWLMLTTEEWDQCLKDPSWRTRLAQEFNIKAAYLNDLYDRAHNTTRPSGYHYSNRDLFTLLRRNWQKFGVERLQKPQQSFYPSGTTLRQIASGFKPLAGPTFLPERCGGGGGVDSTSLGYGPIAFWLMLLTEDWKPCLQQDVWRAGLAKEFNMPQDQLDDLYQLSEDKKLVSGNQPYSNQTAFETARVQFRQFLDPLDFNVYGGHPCSSGKTLLQIARGGK